MKLVIVESPSKAKTINKYLGNDYNVLASFGHVRDLPAKNGSVDTENDFNMIYEVDSYSQKHVTALTKAAKECDAIYLATDPDREGEAISWHVLEVLQQKKALKKNTEVHRVVFHEITKKAVTKAIANPRDIDMNLVNAQQARRALDYLVGFSLSPVLWRKLPGSKSAGRVQSVALRLICEREAEIEAFITREYWDISAVMQAEGKAGIKAKLTHWQGNKLDKFDIIDERSAVDIETTLKSKTYAVSSVEPKQVKRNPSAPFTTSTLQQEASRKLGFGAKKTMQLAQKLYEGVPLEGGETTGLITYMRTDSVHLSGEAIGGARYAIEKHFGKEYLPDSPRQYTSKAKNAQEAHEAIRPTDPSRMPEYVTSALDKDMLRLYELIWKRTIASQMASAILDQVAMEFAANDNSATLRATGSTIKFDGFLKLYREGLDDQKDDVDDEDRILPNLSVGTSTDAKDIAAAQHFTDPPPRFSEASLVKKLEELGIGRPSTYASILSVLQDRNYVLLDKKRFIPEARGRLVNAFLTSFFERYVQPEFTARIEERLDHVSAGELEWKEVLRDFWDRFSKSIDESKDIRMSEVLDILDRELEPFIFPASKEADGKDPRSCPVCGEGRLSLRLGRYGAYVSCSRYPECTYTREVSGSTADGQSNTDSATAGDLPKVLGNYPDTGADIWLKKGPYGIYVEMNDGGEKPKRTSLLKGMEADSLTLETAIKLLSLPRDLGSHPDTGQPILAGVGRYGPFLLHDKKYTTLKGDDDVLNI
ncbi:MAG: type I DNA topoisomerase, partial [Alphaproteobacteria bacterium]|nr:type I DNA topoisomerase [Alphaproteobacteria bacterium]